MLSLFLMDLVELKEYPCIRELFIVIVFLMDLVELKDEIGYKSGYRDNSVSNGPGGVESELKMYIFAQSENIVSNGPGGVESLI